MNREEKAMRKIFPIILLCICIGSCGGNRDYGAKFSSSERITVGVLDFDRNANDEKLEQYRKSLTDMFITELWKMPELRPVERSRLDAVMSEFELGELGILDSETIQKIGRALGAQALYYGGFILLPEGKMLRLDARLVRVETSEVLAAGEGTAKKISDKELLKVVRVQAKKIASAVKESHKELIADNFYSKGETAEDEKDKSSAIANYQKALQYYPGHEKSREALARLQQ